MRPAVAADHLAVGERAVGPEVGVVGGFEPRPVADMQRARGAMRAFGQNQRAGRRLDRRHAGRMVAVGVGDENMRDGLAAHRVEQRRAVHGIVGAGIDDGDFAAADDVAHRALEGERARIVAQTAAARRASARRRVRARVRGSCRRECRQPYGISSVIDDRPCQRHAPLTSAPHFAIIPARRGPARSPKTSRRAVSFGRVWNAFGGDMRHASVASAICRFRRAADRACSIAPAAAASFSRAPPSSSGSTTTATSPSRRACPTPCKALSESGALREPETAGFYVGFVAGVLGANPKDAERLIDKMLPLPPADQWLVVRAIAYSGLPAWKSPARAHRGKAAGAARHDRRLPHGALPTLDAIELDKNPTFMEKVSEQLGAKPKVPPVSYGRNPELLDTLWGQYFASGQYRPIWRIMTLLPWSKERDSAERLTVGSSAKYTLANNAARYPDVLAMIKNMAAYQEADVRPILKEVIHAAETTETSAIRKEQLALVDKMKRRERACSTTPRSGAPWPRARSA